MLVELRGRLAVAARFGDPETRGRAFVTLAAQVTLVLLPAYFWFSWLTTPESPYVYAICSMAWLAGALSLVAIRSGRVKWAANLLVAVIWLVVAALVLSQGAGSRHVGAFAPAIVAVGLLLSVRLTLAMTAASMLVTVAAHGLHMAGAYGAAPESDLDLAAPLAQLFATGAFVAGLIHAYSQTVAKLRAREEELERSELRYLDLFRHAPDGMLLLSPTGEIQACNAAAERCLRWTNGGARPQSFLELPFDPASKAVAGKLSRGEVASGEVVLVEGSQPRVLSINATPLEGGGSSGGVQLSLRDETQARQAETAQRHLEERLRRSERMEAFGQLAGGVAHDFNNLLTIMFGQIALLRRHQPNTPTGSAVDHDLRQIERAAERGAAITRQLLAFSRKSEGDRGEADVARSIAECRSTVERLVRENIELVVRVEQAGTAGLSPLALEQILVNLAANACDAMPHGGRLTIEAEALVLEGDLPLRHGVLTAGRYAVLRVGDTGTGMSSVALERAFEPFFTTKLPGRGTGLGLSSVHGIVERAGGRVDVHSELDRGTTFSVYLPQITPSKPSVPPEVVVLSARARELTVLICEDETLILNAMSEVLRRHGYLVRAASSPVEALAMGRSLGSELDLLITDVIMPEMNGRQLADALQMDRAELPVLFTSGYTAGLLQDLGIRENDDRLLQKPFKPGALLSRVSAALGKSESLRVGSPSAI